MDQSLNPAKCYRFKFRNPSKTNWKIIKKNKITKKKNALNLYRPQKNSIWAAQFTNNHFHAKAKQYQLWENSKNKSEEEEEKDEKTHHQ